MTFRGPLVLVCFLAVAAVPAGSGHAETSGLLDGLTVFRDAASHRASSADPDLEKNGDSRSIGKGETLVLADLEGPGVITHLWCTVSSDNPFYARALVLRIYYDGSEKPSVAAPLGDFFGVGHGAFAELDSFPVSVNSLGRARSCYWRMPFRKSARVTVTNESDQHGCGLYYYLDWEKRADLPEDTVYFCAQYRQATPAEPGDYVILDTKGRGHYVGTVYSVHQVENGWFGEGDDRFYIDGEETPSLRGTGSEDYFSDAWGFRGFCRPFFGVSLWEGYFAGDRVTAYRWHVADPVVFRESLTVSIEHKGSIITDLMIELGGFFERPDWISSVALWYQSPPAQLDEALPPLSKRLPPYRIIPADDLTVRADPAMLLLREQGAVAYLPATPEASIEIDFDLPEAGRYVVAAVMGYLVVGAQYQPLMDGQPFGGPIDFCGDGLDMLYTRLDIHELTAGTHTLRFEGRGVSPKMRVLAKPVYAFGLKSLILLRLEDMAGYREKMKEVQQNAPKKSLW